MHVSKHPVVVFPFEPVPPAPPPPLLLSTCGCRERLRSICLPVRMQNLSSITPPPGSYWPAEQALERADNDRFGVLGSVKRTEGLQGGGGRYWADQKEGGRRRGGGERQEEHLKQDVIPKGLGCLVCVLWKSFVKLGCALGWGFLISHCLSRVLCMSYFVISPSPSRGTLPPGPHFTRARGDEKERPKKKKKKRDCRSTDGSPNMHFRRILLK